VEVLPCEGHDHAKAEPAALGFAILCGVAAVTEVLVRKLEREGLRFDPAASLAAVLDTPPGFALDTLETAQVRSRRLVVVTLNPCIEYCEDLWDMRPAVLLVGRHLDLRTTLQRAARGERYREAPPGASRLTPAERRMLRLLARGWSNQRIAAELSLQYQSVLNALGSIYKKLGVGNRNEAALYYWGIWQAIDRLPHLPSFGQDMR
jgi:DNA-binding CsgD family transcriptional regulator